MERILLDIKKGLQEMGVDVSDFAFYSKEETTICVIADGTVYVVECDQYFEEGEIVQTYPVSMLHDREEI